jgi:hypothetical protein
MIFVGIPAYDRKVSIQTAQSLLNEYGAAHQIGTDIEVHFTPGCSLITLARNYLVKRFLASEAQKMVFIDSDVAWEPGALIRLASYKRPIVAGVYRFKDDKERYPVHFLKTSRGIWTDKDGLVEVATAPTGFMCIDRKALRAFQAKYPKRNYKIQGEDIYAFFENPYRDGELVGEDCGFCIEMRKIGQKVYIDPEMMLTHVDGPKEYTGKISDFLRGQDEAKK